MYLQICKVVGKRKANVMFNPILPQHWPKTQQRNIGFINENIDNRIKIHKKQNANILYLIKHYNRTSNNNAV